MPDEWNTSAPTFPSTRFQGSKVKLVERIWQEVACIPFETCLDAFGGTGVVGYHFKRAGKRVTYNDALVSNFLRGKALIENSGVVLPDDLTEWLLRRHRGIAYGDFVAKTFPGIYYTDEENAWIDQTIANIRALDDEYLYALAFSALAQACLAKRPYNLFHRANLYLREADVPRSFGNKATWDMPFDVLFRRYVAEMNRAVFDTGRGARARCGDALDVPGEFDLVYIDPPYVSGRGVGVDYHGFYHFLEGLAHYDSWAERIDYGTKHRRLRREPSAWTRPRTITGAFEQVFARYQRSVIVVSYRSDGVPSIARLVEALRRYKASVRAVSLGEYQYVLSRNTRSQEVLLIGE